MLPLTIRLGLRTIHLVRDPHDSETCRNHDRHVRAAAGHFLQGEIIRAGKGDASVLANLRAMAGRFGLMADVHRATDPKILEHVAWLLDTKRLHAIECVLLRPDTPLVRATASSDAPAPVRQKPIEDPKTWVGIELVDDVGRAVAGQRYSVKVPEGVISEGILDAQGRARITNIDPGVCEISFPDIDAREYKKI